MSFILTCGPFLHITLIWDLGRPRELPPTGISFSLTLSLRGMFELNILTLPGIFGPPINLERVTLKIYSPKTVLFRRFM
jgi:hypothetical protein